MLKLKFLVLSHIVPEALFSGETATSQFCADEGGEILSEALTQLSNFAIMSNLPVHLARLLELQNSDLVEMLNPNLSLFSDVPLWAAVLKHNIDVDVT